MPRAGLVDGRRTAFLVGRRGCVGVVRGAGRRGSVACVGWLNVRSSALLDLYLRFFCILDVVLMYF